LRILGNEGINQRPKMAAKSAPEALHTRLARLMRQKGIAQKDIQYHVSRTVGPVSDSTVYRWFAGRSLPDAHQILALARMLGVSLDELITGERFPHHVEERFALTDDEHKLLWLAGMIGLKEAARRLATGLPSADTK
jgi:transcriptional regulator with XRE-family HTH domain